MPGKLSSSSPRLHQLGEILIDEVFGDNPRWGTVGIEFVVYDGKIDRYKLLWEQSVAPGKTSGTVQSKSKVKA